MGLELITVMVVLVTFMVAGAVYYRFCKEVSVGLLDISTLIMGRRKGGDETLENEDIDKLEADNWVTYEELRKITVIIKEEVKEDEKTFCAGD